MRYKFLTFTFSLLLLTSTLAAQETGILYLKKVNGKIGWFDSGNAQKNWKYTGEIFDGKPNGTGVLSSPFENYSGEFKNGRMHGQVTHTCKSGKRKRKKKIQTTNLINLEFMFFQEIQPVLPKLLTVLFHYTGGTMV